MGFSNLVEAIPKAVQNECGKTGTIETVSRAGQNVVNVVVAISDGNICGLIVPAYIHVVINGIHNVISVSVVILGVGSDGERVNHVVVGVHGFVLSVGLSS